MYFSQLSYLRYEIDGFDKLVTNILTRITVSKELKDNIFLYEEYSIKDGETPESVAFDKYGSTEYHWVILLTNNIIYTWNDWALPTSTLLDICKEKYGIGNLYQTHHYIDSYGNITSQTIGNTPVSNWQYESDINDKKRNIKILSPSLLNAFVKDFNSLIETTQ